MELFSTPSGAIYYCHGHNMFTMHFSCVSLSFYSIGLKKLLIELKKILPVINDTQRIPMNISARGAYLNLNKDEISSMIYLVEGTLCAYHALELISE